MRYSKLGLRQIFCILLSMLWQLFGGRSCNAKVLSFSVSFCEHYIFAKVISGALYRLLYYIIFIEWKIGPVILHKVWSEVTLRRDCLEVRETRTKYLLRAPLRPCKKELQQTMEAWSDEKSLNCKCPLQGHSQFNNSCHFVLVFQSVALF